MIKENDVLRIEKLSEAVDTTTSTDKVLLVHNGKETKVGTPFLPGAAVELKILSTGLSDKVRIFKMKSKKRYKRLRGHRQPFTEVKVMSINA